MSANLIPEEVGGERLTGEQSAYLEGLFAGVKNRGVSFGDVEPGAGPASEKKKKVTPEEKIKADLNPLDALPLLRADARENRAPEKENVFRYKWNGLFWLAPVHEGYMCRLRIPGGVVTSEQVRELANISDDIASGYLQITTRNNFQVRVVQPKDTPELLRRIQDCGLQSRGSGADNLRNFTSNPTAGIDAHELVDVLPLVRDLAHEVINGLEFYDLPRKYNISFDGGGMVGVAEDTNDIGMRAVELEAAPEGHRLHGKLEAGVYFQVLLGGVTGHEEFAEHSGVICRPEEAVDVVTAMTRVYVEHGNRGNRGKARLVYLLKDWGFEKFLEATEEKLGWDLMRFDAEADAADGALVVVREKPAVPHPHLGAHAQRQEGLNYLGVYVPVGILPSEQARGLAAIAEEYGSGELRLTIWQNLIIPNIPDEKLEAAKAAVLEAGLDFRASMVRGAVAACTGNRYCKYASSDTKGHSMELVDFLDERMALDDPINIHVTGCPHSCAQHYIGDIGLLACKVKRGEESLEGYHVFVGGGFGANKRLGRQLFKSVVAGEELNRLVLAMLEGFMEKREEGERFLDFVTRHEEAALVEMTEARMAAGGIA
ncbi:MAG: NirA family protein [Verrucomicrobiota bacterium]